MWKYTLVVKVGVTILHEAYRKRTNLCAWHIYVDLENLTSKKFIYAFLSVKSNIIYNARN